MTDYYSDSKTHVLTHDKFPLSSKYNPNWVFENEMGPNALWLTEWGLQGLKLNPNDKVLDLGCGKAVSSIFIAKEYGAKVWANDLWISAADNWKRISSAGLEDNIFPIHAEAHNLPYADQFFDHIVSFDSYQYYGTDELYGGYIKNFLKIGGTLTIVVPGLQKDLNNKYPEYFKLKQKSGGIFWAWDMCVFHDTAWWANHFSKIPFFKVDCVQKMEDGGKLWLEWEKALDKYEGKKNFPSDIEFHEIDNNRTLTFIKIRAVRVE
jgi:SAM-dependent methyltransferase